MLKLRKRRRHPVFCQPLDPGGFGDRWACINFLLKLSEKWDRPVRFYPSDRYHEFKLMISLLDSTGTVLFDTGGPRTGIDYCRTFRSPYCPTKRAWRPNRNPTVTYQFDGRTYVPDKNFHAGEDRKILHYLRGFGYKVVNVGGPWHLADKIKAMSRSRAFVGVCSGMAQVACSVGVPSFIILNKMDWAFHKYCIYGRKKNVTLCTNWIDFLRKFKDQFPNDPIHTTLL